MSAFLVLVLYKNVKQKYHHANNLHFCFCLRCTITWISFEFKCINLVLKKETSCKFYLWTRQFNDQVNIHKYLMFKYFWGDHVPLSLKHYGPEVWELKSRPFWWPFPPQSYDYLDSTTFSLFLRVKRPEGEKTFIILRTENHSWELWGVGKKYQEKLP